MLRIDGAENRTTYSVNKVGQEILRTDLRLPMSRSSTISWGASLFEDGDPVSASDQSSHHQGRS